MNKPCSCPREAHSLAELCQASSASLLYFADVTHRIPAPKEQLHPRKPACQAGLRIEASSSNQASSPPSRGSSTMEVLSRAPSPTHHPSSPDHSPFSQALLQLPHSRVHLTMHKGSQHLRATRRQPTAHIRAMASPQATRSRQAISNSSISRAMRSNNSSQAMAQRTAVAVQHRCGCAGQQH